MYTARHRALCLYLLLLFGMPFHAQADQEDVIEIVEVTAPATDDAAAGYIGAETYYDAEQIQAVGASTLEELMEELAPDVASVRGRRAGKPIVLLNGRRIASFREIRSYPPEAVERIEIFPEEVALRHGYRANQKVVNIQLVPRFQATTVKASAKASTEGGGENLKGGSDYVRLRLDQRFSFDVRAEDRNEILESDRSVPLRTQGTPFSLAGNLRAVGGGELDPAFSALAGATVTAATLPGNADSAPLTLEALLPSANNPVRFDAQEFRSLTPEHQSFTSGVSYSHPLGERLLATISGAMEQTEETSYLGLPGYTLTIGADDPFSPFSNAVELNRLSQFAGPLKRDSKTDTYELNGSLAATLNGWTWSWLTNVILTDRKTTTDRRLIADPLPVGTNPFGDVEESLRLRTDRQDSETRDYDTRFLANGVLGELPHGPISVAVTGAFIRNEQRNTTSDAELVGNNRLNRNLAQMRASFDLPLLYSEQNGELSANLNAEASHYSDFDQINVLGVGLSWKPNQVLQLLLSYSMEEGAPSISELGDPLLFTPNQSVYDFVNDESVRATQVSGGNPDLEPDESKVWRLGTRLRPLTGHDLSLKLDWVQSDTDRPIDSFPSPSQEIENAFPERFRRNAAGELIAYDTRPINLDSARSNEMSWGLRYTRPVIKPSRSGSSAGGGAKSRQKSIARRGRNGRLLFALNHTWALKDELRIAPGLDSIDYIGRSAGGSRQGGAEHKVTARLSYYHKGRGIRMSANWQDSTTSLPNADGSIDLNQSDLYTVDVTAFYLFKPDSPLVKKYAWLRGIRTRLDIENVFNEKLRVRDQNGVVPAGRSGDELDPNGRTVKFRLRKMFN